MEFSIENLALWQAQYRLLGSLTKIAQHVAVTNVNVKIKKSIIGCFLTNKYKYKGQNFRNCQL